MNRGQLPAMARRARPFNRRGGVRVALPAAVPVVPVAAQDGEADLQAYEVRIVAHRITAHDPPALTAELRLYLQEDQLLDDLPCPCYLRTRLTSLSKTIYRINVAIQRRNVGLLAYTAEYCDTGKASLTSMSDWLIKCVPAYPGRTRQVQTLGCKCMEFLRVHLRGAFSGGESIPETKAITFMDDNPFSFLPKEEPAPGAWKVPTMAGFVYGDITEGPVIYIRLSRSQCPACQASGR